MNDESACTCPLDYDGTPLTPGDLEWTLDGREAQCPIHSFPTIVCLIGSSRFFEAFMRANYEETMAGRIVLSIGFAPESSVHGESVGCTPQQKELLDKLHKRKIELADEVYVLNVDGYIGSSTRSELEHARRLGKRVRWLEPPSSD